MNLFLFILKLVFLSYFFQHWLNNSLFETIYVLKSRKRDISSFFFNSSDTIPKQTTQPKQKKVIHTVRKICIFTYIVRKKMIKD